MHLIDQSDAAIPAPQRAFLSTLWIFVLLNALMRDVHQFLGQGFLELVIAGQLEALPMSDPFLLAAGVLVQIPLLMVVLPRLLPDRALRVVNTLAAFLFLLVTVAQAAFGQPDADDLLFAAVKTFALIVILRATRPRTVTSAAVRTGGIRASVFLALLSVATTPPVSAQQRGDFEIGLGIGAIELDDKLGGDTGLSAEGRIGYSVTDRFQLEIQHSSASAILDGSFQATTLNGLYYFGKSGKTPRSFSPYGLLGVGRAEVRLEDGFGLDVAGDATDDTLAFRAAIGARVLLGSDRTLLRVEVTGLREEAFGDAATHLGLSSTFLWRFGGSGI